VNTKNFSKEFLAQQSKDKVFTEETRKKITAANIAREHTWGSKIGDALRGKPKTTEHIAARLAAMPPKTYLRQKCEKIVRTHGWRMACTPTTDGSHYRVFNPPSAKKAVVRARNLKELLPLLIRYLRELKQENMRARREAAEKAGLGVKDARLKKNQGEKSFQKNYALAKRVTRSSSDTGV